MSDRNETLAEAINAAVEGGMREMYTSIPAKVVKWDAQKGRADCQILIKNVTTSEDLEREVASWPVVPGVPVEFPGSDDVRITFPIKTGEGATMGRLVFSHRSLDKWLSGSGKEVDPEFDHAHALSDAVFVPGLRPFGAPWQIPDFLSIGFDGETGLQLRFKSDAIIAAGTEANAQFVALAQKLEDDLTQIVANAVTAVIPNDGGAAALGQMALDIVGLASRVKAGKFKAE